MEIFHFQRAITRACFNGTVKPTWWSMNMLPASMMLALLLDTILWPLGWWLHRKYGFDGIIF